MKPLTDLTPWIIDRSGQKFIRFGGLLQEAHAIGMHSIRTEWINQNNRQPGDPFIFRAVVEMYGAEGKPNRVFEGTGDAHTSNVGKMVAVHMLRMAETRAIVRALKLATNVSFTAIEEMGE